MQQAKTVDSMQLTLKDISWETANPTTKEPAIQDNKFDVLVNPARDRTTMILSELLTKDINKSYRITITISLTLTAVSTVVPTWAWSIPATGHLYNL